MDYYDYGVKSSSISPSSIDPGAFDIVGDYFDIAINNNNNNNNFKEQQTFRKKGMMSGSKNGSFDEVLADYYDYADKPVVPRRKSDHGDVIYGSTITTTEKNVIVNLDSNRKLAQEVTSYEYVDSEGETESADFEDNEGDYDEEIVEDEDDESDISNAKIDELLSKLSFHKLDYSSYDYDELGNLDMTTPSKNRFSGGGGRRRNVFGPMLRQRENSQYFKRQGNSHASAATSGKRPSDALPTSQQYHPATSFLRSVEQGGMDKLLDTLKSSITLKSVLPIVGLIGLVNAYTAGLIPSGLVTLGRRKFGDEGGMMQLGVPDIINLIQELGEKNGTVKDIDEAKVLGLVKLLQEDSVEKVAEESGLSESVSSESVKDEQLSDEQLKEIARFFADRLGAEETADDAG